MNIKEAKTEIKNTLLAYTRTDTAGKSLFPVQRQRPILLMGPPGIGKTAILEQIARETGVGLVAYAMTHHTRQSAIGLPHIEHKSYGGQDCAVTEYTMSEIVGSIHDCMARTGCRTGILFLDEVNCVSETLAPTMLQLLQNKTFGSHRIPAGWTIVAAGNPPAYNKSVREFDMATLDRVRLIPVEADLPVWMEYAAAQQVHSAILAWLTIKPEHFYMVEDTADGKFFVTARGWEDLSELLKHYEALDIPVSKALIRQFLQKDEAAAAFAAYYSLYRKYQREYAMFDIADGACSAETWDAHLKLAKNAGFEERFTVIRLLLDVMDSSFAQYEALHGILSEVHGVLEHWQRLGGDLQTLLEERQKAFKIKQAAELLSPEEETRAQAVLDRLAGYMAAGQAARKPDFEFCKQCFEADTRSMEQLAQNVLRRLDNGIRFAEEAFGDGQELVLLISELSHSARAMTFLSAYGCDRFLRHSHVLLHRQRERELQAQCEEWMERR